MEISSLSSISADKVASSVDLMSKILSILPVRSLLRFKSVSKHYYFLIESPTFKLLRSPNPDPPSGLFVPIQINQPTLEHEFVPFDVENPVKPPFRTLDFDPLAKTIDIQHSSNGLMLCRSHSVDVIESNKHVFTHKYYIYNPTVNRFTKLPRFENYDKSSRFGMTLAFDPSKSPHYRIVCVCGLVSNYFIGEASYRIEIYSSETRTCKPSHQFSLDEEIDMDFRNGVYWNDAVHWIHRNGFVFYFDLDEEKLDSIRTPFNPLDFDAKNDSSYIFESRDRLLVADIHRPRTSRFKIYELERDYSSWCARYDVDLDEVAGSYPEIVNPWSRETFDFAILSLVLGGKDEDSFLVLEIPGKAIRFDLESKTFHKLRDFTTSRVNTFYSKSERVFRQWPNVFQFRESLYGV